eukprot:m.171606 g.171606  ORF g.171606 m.171606 type:complete len:404 (-) comp17279_c0_seq1:208-1419(-)
MRGGRFFFTDIQRLASLCRADLVVAVLRDVADPRQRLVAALLDDLEVPHLDTRHGEVGDLKLHANRRLLLGLLAGNAGQVEVSAHEHLPTARELLDGPHDSGELGRIADCADGCLELWRVGVAGHGDDNLHVVGGGPPLELALGLDEVLDAAVRVPLNDRLDPDQRLDLGAEAVGHELKLAVGRDEGDGAVLLEARQAHALVELDVLELNGLALAGVAARRLEHELVVEAETQLRHAGEVHAHLDNSHHLAAQDAAGCADEQIDRLDDVEEDLVLAVLDALETPGDGLCKLDRHARRHFQLPALLRNVLLQNACVCRLRVAKVHELVEQLVGDDKVVADALLLKLLEVLAEDLQHLVQEDKRQDDVCVAAADGDDVEVLVAHIEEVCVAVREDGQGGAFVLEL